MAEFTRKSLGEDRGLGARLRGAREFQQIDPAVAAKKIGIRLEYLLAIEDDHFEKLPAGLYSRNYVKKYGRLLGFSSSEIKKLLDEQLKSVNTENDPFSQKVVNRKEFANFPKLLRALTLFIILLACLSYLAFYFKKIVWPPELSIWQPTGNLKTTAATIDIQGQTEPEAEVRINGENILSDKQGVFTITVNLKKGLNNITISAKKKYSREAMVERQILVE